MTFNDMPIGGREDAGKAIGKMELSKSVQIGGL
jgi:hypothetical protein